MWRKRLKSLGINEAALEGGEPSVPFVSDTVLFLPFSVSSTSTTLTPARAACSSARRSVSARCWRTTSPWCCPKESTFRLSSTDWPVRPSPSATQVTVTRRHVSPLHFEPHLFATPIEMCAMAIMTALALFLGRSAAGLRRVV